MTTVFRITVKGLIQAAGHRTRFIVKRFVAISDTHNLHRQLKLPMGDVLIHAGDACEKGTREELEDFADWFRSQPHPVKIFVPGNHDTAAENFGSEIVTGQEVHFLHDREISIFGMRIYGTPYRVVPTARWRKEHKSTSTRRSAYMVDDVWAAHIWADIPIGIDVLVTHMPPRGMLDVADDIHWGSQSLLDRVRVVRPRVHVFGHIHDAYGSVSDGGTTFFNVASCEPKPEKTLRATVMQWGLSDPIGVVPVHEPRH